MWVKDALSVLIPMILSLTVHEFAHAWTSARLGDDTAAAAGRRSLNPLVHISVLGTIVLPLSIMFLASTTGNAQAIPFFGWAEPVPVNAGRFSRKITARTGMLLVALAGPLANVLLAFGCAAAWAILERWGWTQASAEPMVALLKQMFSINVSLAIFNMLPVSHLDGQKVLSGLLPVGHAVVFDRFNQQFGHWLLLMVIFFGSAIIMYPFVWVSRGLLMSVGLR